MTLASLVCVIGTAGCAINERGVEAGKPLTRTTIDAPAAPAANTPVSSPHVPPELTLADGAALAIARSPRLSSFVWSVRAADAREVQASVFPNPELSIQLEDVLGSGKFDGRQQAQTTVEASQLIERGGKRRARMAVASALSEAARLDYALKREELVADVATAFIDVLSWQEELKLAREVRHSGRRTLDAAQRRAAAGGSSLLEVRKTEVALAEAGIHEEHVEHELTSKRRALSSHWGESTPTFKSATGSLFQLRTLPALEVLEQKLGTTPEMQRHALQRGLRQAELRLAESKRVQNVTVGAGVRRLDATDNTAFLFRFSVPVPMFDRNQGGVLEAASLERKWSDDEAELKVRSSALLKDLYDEYLHTRTQLEVWSESVLPKAREALVIARDGYGAGRFSYLELIDAQRTLFEARERQIRAASSHHKLAAEIQKLIGLSDSPEKN